MPDVTPKELINSVMGKVYDVLANGDETVPKSEDNFFSWCSVGLPVEAEDFEFLRQGLTGVVKKRAIAEMTAPAPQLVPANGDEAPPAPAPAPATELTPAMLEQLRAEDTARLYMQAENLARMVDLIVDVTRVDNDQFARLNILNNEGTLSDVYQYVLRMSQVMQSELPAETKAKIEKFRSLLTVTKTKKNLIDDSETQVTEPSPLSQIYFQKMAAYEAAALEYNARRIDALTAGNARDVHFWAMNANILRNRVKGAMGDWVSNGYKNDYEQIAAFIDQVMQRDMTMLKQQYRDDLEKARLTGLASGSDFFYTALMPMNFMTSSGWTKISFSGGEFSRYASSNMSTSRWSAGGGGGWLGIGGGRAKATNMTEQSEFKTKFNTDHFSMSFEIAQALIVRPWFKTPFLMSTTWRFDPGNPESKDAMLSDGGTPPRGLMPAYPTAVYFVRNLRMNFGHTEGFEEFMQQHTSSSAGGGGFVHFGPFHIGGSYSRASSTGSSERNRQTSYNSQSVAVDGPQITGFKCKVNDVRRPAPDPSITKWV